ncbi:uncharacterized protein LOC108142308 [Drosophila elegans]|uniref:uncharacterized protein LOC108142308 n=1 Tax=Drosophila elegans TaxID=30023 RepID=UPI0007E7D3D3|nr:uncharacterized protein LOC108142308 [Drosophila elegans]
MGPFGTYIALMTAAWGMQLCPRLYIGSGQSILRLQISSITRAFIEANLYTLLTMLVVLVPFKMFTSQRQRNFKFIFAMPYLLQYISCFWITTQNINELLTSPAILAMEDYVLIHLKMILIFGLQLLALIEMVFVLFYLLKKQSQEVVKYK